MRKRRRASRRTMWRTIGRIATYGILTLGVIALVGAAGVFWYYAKDLPPADEITALKVVESTKIYDRTGTVLLYDIHGEEKRTIIPFEEIPTVVRYATLALEDQDFYKHHGVKITAILRAAISQVFPQLVGGRSSGGSTITQQLIKNTLLTSERTYERKLKEVILSMELERKFTKDEILAMYLNEIPYGSNAYGIEAAAQTFFGKHARELTLDEAALLAALPQQPSRYSPYNTSPARLERLVRRQHYALDQMAELGYITRQRADEAKAIDTLEKITPQRTQIRAPHFVMAIREYLEKRYGKQELEEAGMRVITTIDMEAQRRAETVVREGVERNARYNAENAALVAIDPRTAQVLAMVGSVDYFSREIDGNVNVAMRFRQPGSSFKPYVYLGLFRKGYSPDTILYDVRTRFDDGEDPYEPRNYDGTFRGPVKVKRALAMSLNIPAVKALYLVGVSEAARLARELGVTGLEHPRRYGLSLVLGGGEVTLLNHTHAYATLANGGVRKPLTMILRIEDKEGEVVEQWHDTEGVRVVEEEYVAMLDEALSTNKYRVPAFSANNPLRFDDRPVAAKTGTTNSFRDAWTMGYTPSLAVGVWVGNNDNRPMRDGASGSVVAAPIWRAFLEQSLDGTRIEHFPDYGDDEAEGSDAKTTDDDTERRPLRDGFVPEMVEEKVCRISKKKNTWCLKSDACEDADRDVKRRKFINAHSILHYVDRENPLGPPPKHPERDPQYTAWERGVRKYYEEMDRKIIVAPVPDRKCKSSDFD